MSEAELMSAFVYEERTIIKLKSKLAFCVILDSKVGLMKLRRYHVFQS